MSWDMVCDTMIPLEADSDTDLEKNGTKLKGRRADGLLGIMTWIFGLSVFGVPKVFSEPLSVPPAVFGLSSLSAPFPPSNSHCALPFLQNPITSLWLFFLSLLVE